MLIITGRPFRFASLCKTGLVFHARFQRPRCWLRLGLLQHRKIPVLPRLPRHMFLSHAFVSLRITFVYKMFRQSAASALLSRFGFVLAYVYYATAV